MLYGIGIVARALSVYRRRAQEPEGEANRTAAPKAKYGMCLEAVGLFLAFFQRPAGHPDWLNWIALAAGLASALFGLWAIRELGMQWRVQAVVTKHHKLVTSGPYAIVRNPVYTSLLGMLISSGLIFSSAVFTAIGVTIYLVGTEIRVREEERLLEGKFGKEFDAYRASVPAYLPFMR